MVFIVFIGLKICVLKIKIAVVLVIWELGALCESPEACLIWIGIGGSYQFGFGEY